MYKNRKALGSSLIQIFETQYCNANNFIYIYNLNIITYQ